MPRLNGGGGGKSFFPQQKTRKVQEIGDRLGKVSIFLGISVHCKNSVADPEGFDADPDPTFHADADPDRTFFSFEE